MSCNIALFDSVSDGLEDTLKTNDVSLDGGTRCSWLGIFCFAIVMFDIN